MKCQIQGTCHRVLTPLYHGKGYVIPCMYAGLKFLSFCLSQLSFSFLLSVVSTFSSSRFRICFLLLLPFLSLPHSIPTLYFFLVSLSLSLSHSVFLFKKYSASFITTNLLSIFSQRKEQADSGMSPASVLSRHSVCVCQKPTQQRDVPPTSGTELFLWGGLLHQSSAERKTVGNAQGKMNFRSQK